MLKTKHLRQLIGRLGLIDVLAFFLLCSMFVAVSYGFLISEDSVTNKLSCGTCKSVIEEDFGSYISFNSGESYTKEVAVKNEGNTACYVRVFAEITDLDVRDKISIDWNTEDWTQKQSDGYYYYKSTLSPGDTTDSLFTTLTASADIEDFEMICYEETVQAEGFDNAAEAFAAIR